MKFKQSKAPKLCVLDEIEFRNRKLAGLKHVIDLYVRSMQNQNSKRKPNPSSGPVKRPKSERP